MEIRCMVDPKFWKLRYNGPAVNEIERLNGVLERVAITECTQWSLRACRLPLDIGPHLNIIQGCLYSGHYCNGPFWWMSEHNVQSLPGPPLIKTFIVQETPFILYTRTISRVMAIITHKIKQCDNLDMTFNTRVCKEFKYVTVTRSVNYAHFL